MNSKLYILFLLVAVFLVSCREPFTPENPSTFEDILVVEGYLDINGLESELKLSRTGAIDDSGENPPELNATISVLSADGEVYPLTEQGEGIYVFQHQLAQGQEYTLEILLSNGELYFSDPMSPVLTPEILEAGFVRDEEGVEVFVNTQGDENADDFLWTFEETYVYRPRIRTVLIYDPDTQAVRTRTDEERIDLCFKSVRNPSLLLETSSRFEDQVVFRQTITEIPTGDERIAERYSILISQKAIDPEAVEFWEVLRKNSVDIGTIFSPLPSLISGNIYLASDRDKPVIGYVSLGTVQQTRVFIDLQDVSPWGFNDPTFNDCFISNEFVRIGTPAFDSVFGNGGTIPAREQMEGTAVVGFYTTDRRCADCTLYADRQRPDFWED